MNTINSLIKNRNNNFDLIRLMAAILVIFSHSFPLSMGYINDLDPDPLRKITGVISFGKLAVIVFFIISGYLITQSFDRSKNPIHFLKSRILRILPGLIFVTALTILVLGPIISTLKFNEYFSSKSTWIYLKNIALFDLSYDLPGVFKNNYYPDVVNGSLWTLVYEFKCYIVVLALGMTKLLRKRVVLLLFILTSVMYIMGHGGTNIEILSYFSMGMVYYVYRESIKLDKIVAAIATLIAIICLFFYVTYLMPLIVICITYTIMHLSYNTRIKINLTQKFGDLSYGTYIFAFPIQQTITYYFGGHMEWWKNFLISLPIILILAAISWHLIEKNALKLKNVSLVSNIKIMLQNKKIAD